MRIKQEERYTFVMRKELKEKFLQKAQENYENPADLCRNFIMKYIKGE